jgi:adenylate cyclase, class 2
MAFEVENKYRAADLGQIRERLAALGAQFGQPFEQVDRYYAHPSRDFAATDEALRLRRVGEENRITYKGPKLDRATKTRRELELPLAAGAAGFAQWGEMLEALSFRPVAEVKKTRTTGHFSWEGRDIEAALDQVEGAGSFVEIETSAEAADLPAAQQAISSLAAALGLYAPERRSYLEMVLESRDNRDPIERK